MNFLVYIAKAWHASLSIAHLSAKGIPEMEEAYAQQVFNQNVHDKIDYDQVYFNKINEPDINAAVDVLINGMHNDMIALVGHRFHFDALVGNLIPDQLSGEVSVPLLIFPC